MLTTQEIEANERAQVAQARGNARPRDWPEDFSHENGQYQCRCFSCKEFFLGHKRRTACKLCSVIG